MNQVALRQYSRTCCCLVKVVKIWWAHQHHGKNNVSNFCHINKNRKTNKCEKNRKLLWMSTTILIFSLPNTQWNSHAPRTEQFKVWFAWKQEDIIKLQTYFLVVPNNQHSKIYHHINWNKNQTTFLFTV